MYKTLKSTADFLLWLVFPKRCGICGVIHPPDFKGFCCKTCESNARVEKRICIKCGRRIDTLYGVPLCAICSEHKLSFDIARSPCDYEGVYKNALLSYKFKKETWRANSFCELMTDCTRSFERADAVVYPPISLDTYFKRGYNQSRILAEKTGKALKLPVIENAIVKLKRNKKQSTLSKKERFKNVKGVFAVNPKKTECIKGKVLILVDDVLTTGATGNECAKVLKRAGAKRIYLVTASAVPH